MSNANLVIDRFEGQYEFLNNYYPCKIRTRSGMVFHSAEAFYQSCKLENPKERERFTGDMDPAKAHELGKKIAIRHNWNIIRDLAMRFVVMEKFFQNSELAKRLMETSPNRLINGNYNNDKFWGCIPVPIGASDVWYGENHLGRILGDVRKILLDDFGPGSPKELFDYPPSDTSIDDFIEYSLIYVDSSDWSDNERINHAVDLAWRYGGIDGDHHQKWLVDQMLRTMLRPEEYADFVKEYESNGDYEWETGIAP